MTKEKCREILSTMSSTTILDIRHICSIILQNELGGLPEIDRVILGIEAIAASAIPDDQLKMISRKLTDDFGIFSKIPSISQKNLGNVFRGLDVNRDNAIVLSQIADEMADVTHHLWKQQKQEGTPEILNKEFVFDPEKSVAHFHNKQCKIPLMRLEYYLLKVMLEFPVEKHISEREIIDKYDESFRARIEDKRTLYDVRVRLNKRIKEDLNIEKFIHFKGSNYWRTL